jgi:hypothetical protein
MTSDCCLRRRSADSWWDWTPDGCQKKTAIRCSTGIRKTTLENFEMIWFIIWNNHPSAMNCIYIRWLQNFLQLVPQELRRKPSTNIEAMTCMIIWRNSFDSMQRQDSPGLKSSSNFGIPRQKVSATSSADTEHRLFSYRNLVIVCVRNFSILYEWLQHVDLCTAQVRRSCKSHWWCETVF